ncbi:MAG: ABA4-like family protein [Rubripirellula sp.]
MIPTPESLFVFSNSLALFGWILLVLLPRQRIVTNLIVPVFGCGSLAVLYFFVMIRFAGEADGGFTSLDDVESLFRNRGVLLAGWLHYLVFDLFIGCWQVRDARRLSIPHLWIVPALILTFMVGPIGLLVYYLIRTIAVRRLDLDDSLDSSSLATSSKEEDRVNET